MKICAPELPPPRLEKRLGPGKKALVAFLCHRHERVVALMEISCKLSAGKFSSPSSHFSTLYSCEFSSGIDCPLLPPPQESELSINMAGVGKKIARCEKESLLNYVVDRGNRRSCATLMNWNYLWRR